MNWKLYGWDISNENYKKFYYSDFTNVEKSNIWFGYDYFYKENYHFDDSETGSCYEMWDCVIKPGDVVVDLGANVGFFTRRAAKIASRVISVEGSPEIFSCLIENTHDLENVSCLNAIVIGEDEDFNEDMGCYTIGNKIKITLEKIMDIYNLEKIDFLKCDIEGGEWSIFCRIDPEILSKINRISMEPHPWGNGLEEDFDYMNFYFSGKTRHTFYWNGNPNFYFV